MTTSPATSLAHLPAVTVAQMREVDRLAVEDFGITLEQMMEVAGMALARLAGEALGASAGRRVTVLAGPGNNGAGGLVAARHLANRGADVHVVLAQPVGRLRETTRERLSTLIEMRVPCCVAAWDLAPTDLDALLRESDLLLDALLGYAAAGPPRGPLRDLLEHAAAAATSILSLDVPSGVDPDDGSVDGVALRAAATMTIALPKRGLLAEPGRSYAGQLFVADIGLPVALHARAGLRFADPFVDGPLVLLD